MNSSPNEISRAKKYPYKSAQLVHVLSILRSFENKKQNRNKISRTTSHVVLRYFRYLKGRMKFVCRCIVEKRSRDSSYRRHDAINLASRQIWNSVVDARLTFNGASRRKLSRKFDRKGCVEKRASMAMRRKVNLGHPNVGLARMLLDRHKDPRPMAYIRPVSLRKCNRPHSQQRA